MVRRCRSGMRPDQPIPPLDPKPVTVTKPIEVLSAQRKEAGAKFGQAKATLDQARVDLDKTVVKASIDGAILKVNVRLGEYAQAGVLSDPLVTMGSVDPLHVRVDIDETETWRIRPGHAALARLRGNPEISAPLTFVGFEPYVLAKRSLTGDTTERVDTRVLQAILRIRAERVSGVCRSADRCLYRRPEPSSGNPQPDLRSNRLQPGF